MFGKKKNNDKKEPYPESYSHKNCPKCGTPMKYEGFQQPRNSCPKCGHKCN